MAPGAGERVCGVSNLPDNAGKEFIFGEGDKPFRMFVVRQGGDVRAYVNACAHFGVPLNPGPTHDFLTKDKTKLLCQVHYAKYAIDDGQCLNDECDGEGLEPIPVAVRDGAVFIGN